jgi:hypothetical protein
MIGTVAVLVSEPDFFSAVSISSVVESHFYCTKLLIADLPSRHGNIERHTVLGVPAIRSGNRCIMYVSPTSCIHTYGRIV